MKEWIELEFLRALELKKRQARINQSAVGGRTKKELVEEGKKEKGGIFNKRRDNSTGRQSRDSGAMRLMSTARKEKGQEWLTCKIIVLNKIQICWIKTTASPRVA